MRIYLVARNPTDSVTDGFLPAAARLGAEVTLLTDDPDAHRRAYAGHPSPPAAVLGAPVSDERELIATAVRLGRPDGILTNSDHLQAQVALAAAYLGLPGKPWAAALRTKTKSLMRAQIARAGLDTVFAVELGPHESLRDRPALRLPGPCVVKPREGVASEDVYLVTDIAELRARVREIRARRPGLPLVVEEFLPGPLHTLETLGSAGGRRVLGAFRTRLGPRPHFMEVGLDAEPGLPPPIRDQVLAQLDALGVGFGACHTEFVIDDGRARLIEVNYRLIGDQCDLMLAELLGEDLFALVLRAHLGDDVAAEAPAPRGPVHGHARAEYVCAGRDGTLAVAPEPVDPEPAGAPQDVVLRYRPLRPTGAAIVRTGTNRDYLGVIRAVGRDRALVEEAVTEFRASHRWDVLPRREVVGSRS